MKIWQQTLFGILIGLSLAAVILLIIRSPGGEGIELIPAPTPQQFVVHITGEVNQPGVYEISRNSRVIDAIKVAGGFTSNADTDAINQADFVQDGSMIIIPANGDTSKGLDAVDPVKMPGNAQGKLININTASQEEIEKLPDIGATKAADIIAYRSNNGRFVKIEDIMNVPGIGQAIFNKIKDLIVVD
ncbi:MAG: helix-hairpin-helix domain-containing protein [Chloroflexi bacterium]|nr:helix-hairpin-helix domain-containing protein [Chloroflexota bacterium]